jgi:uroporphyrinogen decarboxylase
LKKEKKLISVLNGVSNDSPPIWLMRQAGRYLPEYRALRARAGSFWAMCNDPDMATEITLQPIRRFGFDAAIIFSDILTVPYALGREIVFTEGEGPTLIPLDGVEGLERDPVVWSSKLSPAYETIGKVHAALNGTVALLGFAGAPWTLATYMAAGRGGDEQQAAKKWAGRDPVGFQALIDLLGDCVVQHLVSQIDAGADAVQLFDSWAGSLTGEDFVRWAIEPAARVTKAVREQRPHARIIGFPRGMQPEFAERFLRATGVNAISVDTHTSLPATKAAVSGRVALQGNLDPLLLVEGGDKMRSAVKRILDEMRGHPFIFNLGHGVVPQTPIAHVEELLKLVRSAV